MVRRWRSSFPGLSRATPRPICRIRSTIISKESVLRIYLMPRFGQRRLDMLTDEDIQRLKAVSRWMAKAQKRVGLPVTRALHVLQHTFCSRLAMRGAPAKAIQELAGHENLSTTQDSRPLSWRGVRDLNP